MLNCSPPVITGRGVVSAIGMGQSDFIRGLQQGAPVFDVMTRSHRQHHRSNFIGAQLNDALLQQSISIIVESGEIVLGQWQGIYLAEFRDGQHLRKIFYKYIPDPV